MKIILKTRLVGITALLLILLFSMILTSTQQVRLTDASPACIGYQPGVNTITVNCDASFADVVQAINDPQILEQEGGGAGAVGQYILNANLEVADGITFAMTSAGDGLQYLKLAGENGIIVNGKILIDGVKITSWDIEDGDVITQDINGTIHRGYIQFAASEGSQILNSEFGYLGAVEPGRRGFDLFGGGGPSHNMVIKGSKFHDMWMAFYSNGAYDITVDSNEYYDNIKYSLDPHTTTHDMIIRNNWLHDNPIGAICSDRCWYILIEGNLIENTGTAAIFFSRNMTDSIARNNHVINARTGVIVSESPNNQIYNNTIEGATREGIGLINPELADDGVTEGNMVFGNVISNSEVGIRTVRSHDNVVENTTFFDIQESEYQLFENSSFIIRGQEFNDTLISGEGTVNDTLISGERTVVGGGADNGDQATHNIVDIADSGIIVVTEGASEDEVGNDGEGEVNSYNTDDEPYREILGDGESIIVNS